MLAPEALSLLKSAFINKEFLHLPAGVSAPSTNRNLGWADINQMLRENRLTAPRLRVCKNGQSIPETEYVHRHTLRRGTSVSTIVEEKFYGLLRDGATLVIDAVDQLHLPLDDFCAQLEKEFQTFFQVNAYMSWGETRGFETHWDDHDVMVIQIDGRKDWFLYGETRKHPLYTDLHSKENTAPTECTWNKIIEQGDILFIPRGHWHHAIALCEPSLHLTFGFSTITGLQVVDWLKEKWAAQEGVRQDVPFLQKPEERATYWANLKKTLLIALQKTSLEDFIEEYCSKTSPRQRFSLPEAAVSADALSMDFCFQWNSPWVEGYQLDSSSGVLSFKTIGKVYQFAGAAKPLFDQLITGTPQILGDLYKEFSVVLSEKQVRGLVSELLLRGLIKSIPIEPCSSEEDDCRQWGT